MGRGEETDRDRDRETEREEMKRTAMVELDKSSEQKK